MLGLVRCVTNINFPDCTFAIFNKRKKSFPQVDSSLLVHWAVFLGNLDGHFHNDNEGTTVLRNVNNHLPIDSALTSQDLNLQVHAVRTTDLAVLYKIGKCV